MAEYDESRGAWVDYSGGIHSHEGAANEANQRLMGVRDGSSTSEYNPVDLNSPEYNRKPDAATQAYQDMMIKHNAKVQQAQYLYDRGTTVYDNTVKFQENAHGKDDDDIVKRQFERAIEYYKQALNLNVFSRDMIADVGNSLGLAYAGMYDEATAIDYFSQAIQLREDYYPGYYNRACAYMRLAFENVSDFAKSDEYRNKAIADWKMAADLGCEEALENLAENSVQYTPQKRKKVTKRPKSATFGKTSATSASSSHIKGGRIISGLVLGAICGFLSIIGVGALWMLLTGAEDPEIGGGKALLWTAIIAVVFTFVWYKRKWLWIALVFLTALMGMYVLIGAPGLEQAMTETEVVTPE